MSQGQRPSWPIPVAVRDLQTCKLFFNNFVVLWDYTKTYEVQILPNILTLQAKLSLKIYKRLKHSPNTAMDYNLQPIFLDSFNYQNTTRT